MADNQPTTSTLMRLACEVTSLFQCEKLAKALSVTSSVVKKLTKKHDGVHCQIALGILNFWVSQHKEEATSRALYETLRRSQRKSLQALAHRTQFFLIGTGNVSATSIC